MDSGTSLRGPWHSEECERADALARLSRADPSRVARHTQGDALGGKVVATTRLVRPGIRSGDPTMSHERAIAVSSVMEPFRGFVRSYSTHPYSADSRRLPGSS